MMISRAANTRAREHDIRKSPFFNLGVSNDEIGITPVVAAFGSFLWVHIFIRFYPYWIFEIGCEKRLKLLQYRK